MIAGLIPLAIGLYCLALLKGWLLIKPSNQEFSREWIQKRKGLYTTCAVLTLIAAACCFFALSSGFESQFMK